MLLLLDKKNLMVKQARIQLELKRLNLDSRGELVFSFCEDVCEDDYVSLHLASYATATFWSYLFCAALLKIPPGTPCSIPSE